MKITVKTVSGPQAVEVQPCGVPGLAIGPAHDARGLIICHVRSGTAMAWFPDADPEAVLAAAAALGELLSDWTISAHDVADELTYEDVTGAVARWGGCLYEHDYIPGRLDDIAAVTT